MLSSLVRVHTPTGYCSGVLIDPYFILTARHFLRHRTAGDMFVFGDHWNRKVSGWIDLATTDISVLRLARPVMEADHPTITPTPLPTAASLPPAHPRHPHHQLWHGRRETPTTFRDHMVSIPAGHWEKLSH